MLACTSGLARAATFIGGVSVADGDRAAELVSASGGSTSTPRHHIQTFELGLGLPIAGQFEAGIFTTQTDLNSGFGRFTFRTLGGSLGRPLVLGSNLDIRFGLGFGNGSGADHATIGVTEFVFFLPIPLVKSLGVAVTHQILVVKAFSAAYDVIHINRIGLTARLSK